MMFRYRPARHAGMTTLALSLLLLISVKLRAADESTTTAAASERRISQAAHFLSADQQEGRGIGTDGLLRAGEFIAEQFAALGLKTALFDGGPYQAFDMATGAALGQRNELALVGPKGQRIELTLGKDFNPLAIGGSGQIDLPLVFAGYGISAPEANYDDYDNLETKKTAVILMRHEPEQNNPHSAFNGTQHSVHAPYVRKVSNAYQHGAEAIVFFTDDVEIQARIAAQRKRLEQSQEDLKKSQQAFAANKNPSAADRAKHAEDEKKLAKLIAQYESGMKAEADPLVGFEGAGQGSGNVPVVFVRRSVLEPVIKQALGSSLTEVEKKIDQGPAPQSRALEGWRLVGEISVLRKQAPVRNVVAVLEGDGSHGEETIVIGAHYDHLGLGGSGSLAPGAKEIHNGADDNASGTSTLIDIAARLAATGKKLPRRVVFIAFTGEEAGLIGSAKYCQNPLVPLEDTVAMLNLDMVGRLRDDKLIIQGVDTAQEFGDVVDDINERLGFKITRQPGGFGPSDHSSFYAKKVPVMHFFTGTHEDYHRPSDDVDKLNVSGMRRIGELIADMAVKLAEADKRPTYQEVKPTAQRMGGGGDRPYFGSIPDFSQDQPGYAISGVTKDGPADRGGLKGGDILVRLGEHRIGNLEDFDFALRKFKTGDTVPVIVLRGGKEVELNVTLDPPR